MTIPTINSDWSVNFVIKIKENNGNSEMYPIYFIDKCCLEALITDF